MFFIEFARSHDKVSNLFECDRSNTRNNVPLLTMSLGKTSLTKTVYTHYISNICTSTVNANLNNILTGLQILQFQGHIVYH